MKKFLKALFDLPSDLCEVAASLWLGTRGEIVNIPSDQFGEYEKYDQLNPHRFEVRYDANGNRMWHNEYKS